MVKSPTQAIITAAGLSSLFLPISLSYPREMLMINNKPVIHHVVDEAISAGIQKIIIVVDENRENIIQSYFEGYEEFNKALIERKQFDKINELKKLEEIKPKIKYKTQEEHNGHGGAILKAKDNITKGNPFVVMFGDAITKSDYNCTKRLIEAYEYYESPILSVQNVQPTEVKEFGIIRGTMIGNDIYKIRKTVEKPGINESPSSLAIMGRYICDHSVFDAIKKCEEEGKTNMEGKLLLSDAINEIIKGEKDIYAQRYFGEYFSIFNELQLLKASLRFIVDDEDITKETIDRLDEMNLKIKKLIQ